MVNLQYPKFLKFPDGKRIVKIFSATQFEEYSVLGKYTFYHLNEAKTHADRIYVMDLVENSQLDVLSEENYELLKAELLNGFPLKSM